MITLRKVGFKKTLIFVGKKIFQKGSKSNRFSRGEFYGVSNRNKTITDVAIVFAHEKAKTFRLVFPAMKK